MHGQKADAVSERLCSTSVRALWLLGVAASGCGFHATNLSNTDGGTDATPDTPIQTSFGTFVKVTFTSPEKVPTSPLVISSGMTISTDSLDLCNQDNDQATEYCVVVGSEIQIDANVNAIGPKPIIFLSVSSFELNATINVGSVRNSQTGAGASSAAPLCTGTTSALGLGGGYGGSFGGMGGAGATATGTGGVPAPALTSFPATLRGGCPGGNGASLVGGAPGAGGAGGGAVDIIATSLVLNGNINASGASGEGGTKNNDMDSGGGGGGAGGMIVLDTPSVTIEGAGRQVFANGGGGGQGGTGSGTGVGNGDGGNESNAATTIAIGGQNPNRGGGAGGNGSAGTKKDADRGAEPANGGGGGGGGGAGFIRAPSLGTADVSPGAFAP